MVLPVCLFRAMSRAFSSGPKLRMHKSPASTARSIAKHMIHLSKIAMPLFLAVEAVTIEPSRTERSDDSLAICHWLAAQYGLSRWVGSFSA